MKTVAAPLKDFIGTGNTLTNWLGMFWTKLYEDADLAEALQHGQGVLAAQLYLNYLEAVGFLGRKNLPVFHRERWHPVIIRRSERNKGNANALRLDMEPPVKVGAQPHGTAYPAGRVYKVGGHAEYSHATSYPLPEGMADALTCICDNIAKPEVVLLRGVDFIVRNETVLFLRDRDPFDNMTFPRRIAAIEGREDEEIMLWCSDTLIDKDQVYQHLGYVLGIHTASTEFYKKMLNGLWDLYTDGPKISILRAAIGAMLGEPTIIHAHETVEAILEDGDTLQIVTDREVYRVNPDATLRTNIEIGAELRGGDFLTETIRLYDNLNPRKTFALGEYGDRLRQDVFSMFFGPELLAASVNFGVGASWDMQDIVYAGEDANGNPKLKFKLYGNPEDVDIFWDYFWSQVEKRNISSETCFTGYIDDIVVPVSGAVYGRVEPLKFIMENFMIANAAILVVDSDKLTDPPKDRDPVSLLTYLAGTLPAHTLLRIVEQRHVRSDSYDLEDVMEDKSMMLATTAISTGNPGARSISGLTYQDRPPLVKLIPQCS